MSEFRIDIERSDGRSMSFGDGTEWVLSMNSMDEWVALDYEVETEASVISDGSMLVSERVADKDRMLSAVYWGNDNRAARDAAVGFFNPKHTFRAHLTYYGRTRWCEGVQTGFDCPIAREGFPTKVTWTLLCPDPYMRDENANEASFTDALPHLGFPFVSHLANSGGYRRPKSEPAGFPCSVLVYDGKNTVYNAGDVPTYYTVVVKARGELVNPTITKDGKFVKYVGTVAAGTELRIDFESAPPKVTLNGVNAIASCSRDSSFTGMRMQVGKNVFSFTVDNPENRSLADVQILYNAKFLGV